MKLAPLANMWPQYPVGPKDTVAYDLRAYLEARFGFPKTFNHRFADVDLSGMKGVILFGMRHSDLWDGSQVRYNTDFTDGTKTVSQIRVWETPS
jgi:hypothetical protein